jgi:tetratricopeptide (TPR) repeat protein
MDRIIKIITVAYPIVAVAVVFGWLMWRWLKHSHEPARLVVKWIQTALVLVYIVAMVVPTVAEGGYGAAFGGIPMAAVGGLLLAFIWGPSIGDMFGRAITSVFDGGSQEIDPHPSYDIGQSLVKRGRYLEAEVEFKNQLARFPKDFTGHMLLAELQITHLKNGPGATETLECYISQSGHAQETVAYALNRLSDLRLQAGEEESSVREPLERIAAMFPDTEVGQKALQRLAHLRLPTASEDGQPRRIAVPRGVRRLGLRQDMSEIKLPDEDLSATAAALVKQLEHHPQDWDAREQLARIYAEHFQQIELAVDQLEQLIDQPGQPAKKVIFWLNMMADFYSRQSANLEKAQECLQRIIKMDPESGPAQQARQRLSLLALELRGQQATTEYKLGTYEQNLGLKEGGPKPPWDHPPKKPFSYTDLEDEDKELPPPGK